jgi:hypothetical protein
MTNKVIEWVRKLFSGQRHQLPELRDKTEWAPGDAVVEVLEYMRRHRISEVQVTMANVSAYLKDDPRAGWAAPSAEEGFRCLLAWAAAATRESPILIDICSGEGKIPGAVVRQGDSLVVRRLDAKQE